MYFLIFQPEDVLNLHSIVNESQAIHYYKH